MISSDSLTGSDYSAISKVNFGMGIAIATRSPRVKRSCGVSGVPDSSFLFMMLTNGVSRSRATMDAVRFVLYS